MDIKCLSGVSDRMEHWGLELALTEHFHWVWKCYKDWASIGGTYHQGNRERPMLLQVEILVHNGLSTVLDIDVLSGNGNAEHGSTGSSTVFFLEPSLICEKGA